MEFIKTCNTNAQAITGFEAISYQAFSVTRSLSSNPPSPHLDDRPPSEDVRAVEQELREDQQLVAQDVNTARKWLWLFRGTTVDKVGEQPEDLPAVAGYTLQREQCGVMKAIDLGRPSTRGGPQQQQTEALLVIYEMFTSAIMGVISYYLVKHYNYVALNFRTFLFKPMPLDQDSEIGSQTYSAPYCLTSLNVYWASSGTLLVSAFCVTEPAIQCLDALPTSEPERECVGRCVRVAPNGSLAQVVSFEDPVKASTADIARKPRKIVKLGPLEREVEKWKSAVTRWLSRKGYSLPDLEKNSSWVRIRLAHCIPPTTSDPYSSHQPHDVWWPRALCFLYDTSAQDMSHNLSLLRSPTNPLDWFATPHSTGYQDPIDTVEQWFLGKAEREKALEARRRAQKVETELARPKEENPGGLFPPSPLNARTNAYGDVHAASGMYPTPPDGVAPGTAMSHNDTPGTSHPASNTVLVKGGTNPTINLSAPQESAPQKEEQSTTSPQLKYDGYDQADGDDDDLFEDMDEDFGGNGVTDADFNFFDDPGGDDVDMRDAPSAHDNAPEISTHAKGEMQPPPVASQVNNKEEHSDPMAALENALASASASHFDQGHDTMMIDAPDASMSNVTTEKAMAPTYSHQDQTSDSAAILPESKSPPNSRSTHGDVLPLTKNDSPVHSAKKPPSNHRNSIFNPVVFDRKMSLLDSKYQDGRFSFPHETPSIAKMDTKSALKPSSRQKDPHMLRKSSYDNLIHASLVAVHPSDESDTASETTSSAAEGDGNEDDEEEEKDGIINDTASIAGSLPATNPFDLRKRKLPTDGNRTPLSVTSYADSFGGGGLEFAGIQTDEGGLSLLEPNPWDWSLTGLPPPTELQSTTGRYSIPAFSPAVTSLPNTPTSQPDLSFDPAEEKSLSRSDCIAVAQVVSDQIVSATLDVLDEDASSVHKPATHLPNMLLSNAIKHLFPKAQEPNLSALAAVADTYPEQAVQPKGQQRGLPRRPNDGPFSSGSHIFTLQPPYIRVKRSESLWELLPTAVAFWESLGLASCSTPKNVSSFYIYPHSESLVPYLENFRVNLKIAYEACKLGNHDHGGLDTVAEFDGGLVPWEVNMPVSTRGALRSLRDTCVALGKALSAKHAQAEPNADTQKTHAFVIYMVNPFEDPSAIWELSAAFWALFQAYGQGPSTRGDMAPKPDLVLQIVPIKYIASFDVPLVLDATTYASLAREVYDRCPPSAASEDRSPLSIYAAPCFQLEEPPPRKIEFRVQSEPPQDLLRENSFMHVGYAISLDGNWLSAAWTDTCGKSRAVVSYHLGTRPFFEVAKEIWQTTMEICQSRKVAWRVCIARNGAMEREELDAWLSMHSQPNHVAFLLLLITVDSNTPFKFTPSTPAANSQAAAGQPTTTSPTATPQAGVSPDSQNPTPAATPAPETTDDATNDPDARLVDVTDETWGVILAHRLHNSNSTVEFRPSLISGLIIKRGQTQQNIAPMPPTPDPEPGPLVVAVNILYIGTAPGTARAAQSSQSSPLTPSPLTPTSEGISPGGGGGIAPGLGPGQLPPERDRLTLMWTPSPAARTTVEALLKDVMVQYRGLGTLARLKGIRGTRMGTVPWHVAVAQRAVEGLGRCVSGI